MSRRTYTPEQRAQALELYATDGPTAVQARLGIPKQTVQSWAASDGVRTVRNEIAHQAREAIEADTAQRRAAVEARLWEIADTASAKELELIDQVDKGDLRSVVGARTRAIHDAQLLAGKATGRTEHLVTDHLDREITQLLETLPA